MRISEGQKDKLKKAVESNCEPITICLTYTALHDEDAVAITKSQLDRLAKAYEATKCMTIKMLKTQLAYKPENRRRIFTNVG